MADQIVTNEVPEEPYPWWCVYRLVETMLAAGWTVLEMSNGSSISKSDSWTGSYHDLGPGSWIILENGTGQQVLFQRPDSSNMTQLMFNGTIKWSKGGGYSTGGTASSPPSDPSDVAVIRDTTSNGWFGVEAGVHIFNCGVRDASGSDDGAFWVIGRATGDLYAGTSHDPHLLAFEKLDGTEPGDTVPYAWLCPDNTSGAWGNGMEDMPLILNEDPSSGSWRRWWNAGQPSEVFKQYASGALYQGQSGNDAIAGTDPSFEEPGDVLAYGSSPRNILHRIKLMKTNETGFMDSNGGYTRNILFSSPNDIDVPHLHTLDGGAWAKFPNFIVVWWDGDPNNPPEE